MTTTQGHAGWRCSSDATTTANSSSSSMAKFGPCLILLSQDAHGTASSTAQLVSSGRQQQQCTRSARPVPEGPDCNSTAAEAASPRTQAMAELVVELIVCQLPRPLRLSRRWCDSGSSGDGCLMSTWTLTTSCAL
jgi:hypothetical protein